METYCNNAVCHSIGISTKSFKKGFGLLWNDKYAGYF